MPTTTDSPKLNRLERKIESMLLNWSDGVEYNLSYRTLLYWCPCAKCSPLRNDENTASELISNIDKIILNKPQVNKVGSYALNFELSNACNSGIFTFERLYRLCKNESPDDGKPYIHGVW